MTFIRDTLRRIVIKCGTGILTQGIGELDTARIFHFCDQIAQLRQKGIETLVVTSGSIGVGMGMLGLKKRPSENLALLQACAAVGQSPLMALWSQGLARHGLQAAQVLLTRDAVGGRERHINTRNMLDTLLARGVVPIINENDSVSVDEIKFGDNDILSALVASFTKAQMLFILSTAPGLIDMKGTGQILPVVEKITSEIEGMAGTTVSPTAVGGMISKIFAAKVATRSGTALFIGSGSRDNLVVDWCNTSNPPPEGTLFVPSNDALGSRKRWIAFFERPQGTISVDAGAREALCSSGRSLLAKGITHVSGAFNTNDVIEIADPKGRVFARGIARFSAPQIAEIAGFKNEEIQRLHPRRKRLEIIHRDTLVIL